MYIKITIKSLFFVKISNFSRNLNLIYFIIFCFQYKLFIYETVCNIFYLNVYITYVYVPVFYNNIMYTTAAAAQSLYNS